MFELAKQQFSVTRLTDRPRVLIQYMNKPCHWKDTDLVIVEARRTSATHGDDAPRNYVTIQQAEQRTILCTLADANYPVIASPSVCMYGLYHAQRQESADNSVDCSNKFVG